MLAGCMGVFGAVAFMEQSLQDYFCRCSGPLSNKHDFEIQDYRPLADCRNGFSLFLYYQQVPPYLIIANDTTANAKFSEWVLYQDWYPVEIAVDEHGGGNEDERQLTRMKTNKSLFIVSSFVQYCHIVCLMQLICVKKS